MQNKHIFLLLKFSSFFGYADSIIKELSVNNKVTLCIQENNKINSSNYYIDNKNNLVQENKKLNKKTILAENTNNLKIIYGVKRNDHWSKYLKFLREGMNYLSFLIRGDKNTFFLNQSKYVSKKIIYLTKFVYFKFNHILIFNIFKFIHSLIPSSAEIKNFIKTINPDVVIVIGGNWPTRSSEKLSSEIDFIKVSNELDKPSFLHVISWDNLTARGLYHYTPTKMFVWNEDHFNEAIEVHKIPKENLKIIGAPFMDKWFENSSVMSKKEFFLSNGLDINKPLVTYLGSAKNISTSENQIVESIYMELIKHGIQLIVRPHGANSEQFKDINKEIKIIPSQGQLPDTMESKELMIATIKNSNLTIGINTTAMVDSIILKTPCISIIKDEFNFNQSDTPHFNKVKNEKIFIEAKSNYELINQILDFSKKNNSDLFDSMENFVSKFCRPFGTNKSAGELAYDEIKKTLERKKIKIFKS